MFVAIFLLTGGPGFARDSYRVMNNAETASSVRDPTSRAALLPP
ncbi:hypothetical protein AKJ09_02333 [Labilithrix luteola]|uniref:Uncharacterized protein n=1 Tax=Labilithrix luteola TaxID=1391654 RepID=A0A0K1PRC9_9BACT|nr:hypothetical protein AKJ09_02333 [Labilithrix luteola]